ncbi:MAG: hypothetical protein H7296_10350 [Bacteroidia bacterium]|nr:hypothetical protein [Bacteroidia bacterium]
MKILTELEKDVLDEFILDIKNNFSVVRIHEDNSKQILDMMTNGNASFTLVKDNISYILMNGEFNDEQLKRFCTFLEEGLIKINMGSQVSFYIGEYIPALCFYVECNPQTSKIHQ